MRIQLPAAVIAVVAACLAFESRADDAAPPKPAPRAEAKSPPAGIQWFATWEQGAAEAKRTGRPILLIAAAPHCHDISGLW